MAEPLEVRCVFCRKRPLLAVCGRDEDTREPFIHVKSWKQDRLYTEVIVLSGTAMIRCRVCLRWHRITIKRLNVEIRSASLPETIQV